MSPRKFYLGFPPALAKVRRQGIEYGIGAIPLGGYVKIPGMHRPAAGDLTAHLEPAIGEAPELKAPVAEVASALDAERHDEAVSRLGELRSRVEHADLSEQAGKSADRGLNDI